VSYVSWPTESSPTPTKTRVALGQHFDQRRLVRYQRLHQLRLPLHQRQADHGAAAVPQDVHRRFADRLQQQRRIVGMFFRSAPFSLRASDRPRRRRAEATLGDHFSRG
jgi:hypothetical protein